MKIEDAYELIRQHGIKYANIHSSKGARITTIKADDPEKVIADIESNMMLFCTYGKVVIEAKKNEATPNGANGTFSWDVEFPRGMGNGYNNNNNNSSSSISIGQVLQMQQNHFNDKLAEQRRYDDLMRKLDKLEKKDPFEKAMDNPIIMGMAMSVFNVDPTKMAAAAQLMNGGTRSMGNPSPTATEAKNPSLHYVSVNDISKMELDELNKKIAEESKDLKVGGEYMYMLTILLRDYPTEMSKCIMALYNNPAQLQLLLTYIGNGQKG